MREVSGISLDNELWIMIDNEAARIGLDRSNFMRKLVNDYFLRKPIKVFTIANLSAVLLLIISIFMVLLYFRS